MVKSSSPKKSAVVAGRPRRALANCPAGKGSRMLKHPATNAPSRMPVSELLLGLTEREGREIAVAIAANLTSEGVSAFNDDVRLEILRRSPRDAKGNVIKARECARPEDLKHLTFNEIRHLPLKRCLLCGYIGSRGHTTARHSAAHGDYDKTLVDVPWQVCLVKDAVPSGSMEDFSELILANSGHKPMIAYKQAGAQKAYDPNPGCATCLVSSSGKCASVATGVASPALVPFESSPAAMSPVSFTPSLGFIAPELEIPMSTLDSNIDPLLLGPFGDPFSAYYPNMLDNFVDAAAEINMMIDQNERFAAFEPRSRDDDTVGMRQTLAWHHLHAGGQLDYAPLISVY